MNGIVAALAGCCGASRNVEAEEVFRFVVSCGCDIVDRCVVVGICG